MSSVEYLRDFVNERLTAAAEEIFGVFNKTIIDYKEELDRQCKLLDIVWKPEIKLHRIELPQQHVCKDEEEEGEVQADQQLCIQERNSNLDQEDPEPPQIKEEQEQLCTSQEGEQLELEQETDTFMLTSTHEESNNNEDQTLYFNLDKSQSAAETELPAGMRINWLKDESDQENCEVSEPNRILNLNHDLHQNKTIFKYEEEIDHQRKLLDIGWKPEMTLNRTELPLPHVCKEEEVLADQQLLQIKEEEEKLCITQKGEKLEQKQQTETLKIHCLVETEIPASICMSWLKDKPDWENPEVSEPNSDRQILSHSLSQHVDSGSTSNAEPKPQKSLHKCTSHINNTYNPTMSKIHIDTHTGIKYFKCDKCEKTFKCNSNWQRHLRVHTGEKPYSCNTCGKSFAQKSALISHIRIHSGERPFTCKTCGNAFKSSGNLRDHMRIHTGERPYSCKICGNNFKSSSHLIGHMRTHTNEKRYLCKTCGKYFDCNMDLLVHMRRTHLDERPYLCKTCGKGFSRNTYLLVHMRRAHIGERPYLCKTCGKDFSRNSVLLVHMRRAHTGEEPYLCKICEKRFFDASHLAKHIRSHTGR